MRNACVLLLCLACSSGSVVGLAPAEDTGGPRVLFDLQKKPLPEIPFPNDLATRPDAASPTGLRVNASQIAPTRLEANVRRLLDTLDGFGTYATRSEGVLMTSRVTRRRLATTLLGLWAGASIPGGRRLPTKKTRCTRRTESPPSMRPSSQRRPRRQRKRRPRRQGSAGGSWRSR